MSKFTKDLEAFIRQSDFNIIRVCEVCNGNATELAFTDTYRSLNCYSVSKVFVVTALGILYDRGLIDTDEKILNILSDCVEHASPEFKNLTVDDALKHRMGLEGSYLDIDIFPPQAYGTDFLYSVFNAQTVCKPSSKPIYTDAAFYVLSRVVEAKCGTSIEELLWKHLFTPMGFSEAAWSKCPQAHAMGATGLYIGTRDMAKLGELYLNGGTYGGNQIISRAWVDIVLLRGYELSPCGIGAYGKGGMYGQMLLIVPKQNRVVAWHAFEHKNISSLVDWICNYK